MGQGVGGFVACRGGYVPPRLFLKTLLSYYLVMGPAVSLLLASHTKRVRVENGSCALRILRVPALIDAAVVSYFVRGGADVPHDLR